MIFQILKYSFHVMCAYLVKPFKFSLHSSVVSRFTKRVRKHAFKDAVVCLMDNFIFHCQFVF